ncbi:uncharacterized protein LOC120658085 [Panicum virgatum]|nr:uncharacterized protein LOC120658085 [Panicum virgatum]
MATPRAISSMAEAVPGGRHRTSDRGRHRLRRGPVGRLVRGAYSSKAEVASELRFICAGRRQDGEQGGEGKRRRWGRRAGGEGEWRRVDQRAMAVTAGGPASDGEQAGKVSDSEQAEAGAASGSPRAVQELAARQLGSPTVAGSAVSWPRRWRRP